MKAPKDIEPDTKMLEKKTWMDFKESGLLWFINRTLHLFGWSICLYLDDDGNLIEAYPARCKFRGFPEKSEREGFEDLTGYLKQNINSIEGDLSS